MIDEWVPLHDAFFGKVKNQTVRLGPVIQDAVQGYLIDKKTADKYGITALEQLRDPKLAKLFAARGDKADLTGAEPGWGAERVINHELDALGLRKTVNHDEGQYFTLFADTLSRFRQGNPVLFYTWTPNWTLTFLKPGKDVTFLKVPPSACLPDQPCGASTSGFPANNIYALTNKKFADDNAAARRFLGLVKIPIADINAENLKIKNGENKQVDVQRHVQQWIAAHQQEFDGWIAQAKQAGS
jgi:glycine betaine/proline transport system substrate-binding protein